MSFGQSGYKRYHEFYADHLQMGKTTKRKTGLRTGHIIRLIFVFTLLVFGSKWANAQETRIEGNWVFQAWTGDGCTFTGNATLSSSDEDGNPASCELTARQVCQTREWVVRQTCVATRRGDRVSIKSTIVEFFSEPSDSYLPDDFLLTIDSSKRMFGALHSYGIHKAEWTREIGDIS